MNSKGSTPVNYICTAPLRGIGTPKCITGAGFPAAGSQYKSTYTTIRCYCYSFRRDGKAFRAGPGDVGAGIQAVRSRFTENVWGPNILAGKLLQM